MMNSREATLRSRRFEADEKRRKVSDLEGMISELKRMANSLDRQIKIEEERTGIRDSAHFNYSMFAKSAALRRDNILSSIDGLSQKLLVAQKDCDEAIEDARRLDCSARRRHAAAHQQRRSDSSSENRDAQSVGYDVSVR